MVIFANSSKAYVQDPKGDDNPLTSDGLWVDGGDLLSLVPGDKVIITGRIREIDGNTNIGGSSTSINKVGTEPLPAPVIIDIDTFFNAIPAYERYEGMRVAFAFKVAQGTGDFNSIEVYPTPNRPFREPGIIAPGESGLPVWDGNPELLSYDPNGLGQSNFLFYNAGDQLSGIGIIEEFSFGYEISPIENPVYTPTTVFRPVRPRADNELTVASFNVLFLLEEENNYNLHLNKVLDYIQNALAFPDVIGIQELGGQNELEDLVFRLRQLDPVQGDYRGFVGSGTGSLKSAYLINKRIDEPAFSELGTSELLSTGGILHDRPPLLVRFNLPGDEDKEIQILNLHLRSLNGIDDSDFVRRKRAEQSRSVARMVEDLEEENLIIIGDYNAFPFSDGYVDVFNQIAGTPSLGAEYPVVEIVDPPLRNVGLELPTSEQYSFVFRGSAQQIDHCLISQTVGITLQEMQFARGNADASIYFFDQAFAAPRASDHDAFVVYFQIDALTNLAEFETNPLSPLQVFPNPVSPGDQVSIQLLESQMVFGAQLIDLLGRSIPLQTPRQQVVSNGALVELVLPESLSTGLYTLLLQTAEGYLVAKIKLQ